MVSRGKQIRRRGQEEDLLVDDVFDVVMHALVRPPFVWLYVKGHLCKKTHVDTDVNERD